LSFRRQSAFNTTIPKVTNAPLKSKIVQLTIKPEKLKIVEIFFMLFVSGIIAFSAIVGIFSGARGFQQKNLQKIDSVDNMK